MGRRKIAGCRIVLTGASSGIGRALAIELAGQGADLIVTARREAALHSLADEIVAMGRRAFVVAGDLNDSCVRTQAITAATVQLGGLDILVNNAGVGALGEFADSEPERLRQIMELNFFSLVELTRNAIPLLRQGRQPLIVNVGSILGHRGVPLSSEYCASKFALQGFSQSLRAELAPEGIDVLVVSPGTTDTEFFSHLLENRGQSAWRSRNPMTSTAVAKIAVKAMQSGRHEVFPGWKSKAINLLNRLSPSLMDRIVAKRR